MEKERITTVNDITSRELELLRSFEEILEEDGIPNYYYSLFNGEIEEAIGIDKVDNKWQIFEYGNDSIINIREFDNIVDALIEMSRDISSNPEMIISKIKNISRLYYDENITMEDINLIRLYKKALDENGFDKHVYSIFEGDHENYVHLNRANTKWQVYIVEKGQKDYLHEYDNLKDAMEYFITIITNEKSKKRTNRRNEHK